MALSSEALQTSLLSDGLIFLVPAILKGWFHLVQCSWRMHTIPRRM